jgi:hypothetical protein
MFLRYHIVESGDVFDDEVLPSRRALRDYFSTLKNEQASLVSPRDALNSELASLDQRCVNHSVPSRGPAGQDRRYFRSQWACRMVTRTTQSQPRGMQALRFTQGTTSCALYP